MKFALIVNAGSRKGEEMYAQAHESLSCAGADLVLSEAAHTPGDIPGLIDRAVQAGADRIVLGGGDGTISSSSRQIAKAEVELALLPLGTANSFARSLGVPLEIEEACQLALTGTPRSIDLGFVGDHCFTNIAAIGLPAQIGRTIPDRLKRYFGQGAYLLWGAYKLMRFRGFRCTVSTDAGSETHDVVEVRIANGSNFGKMEAVPHADPESHEIVIQLVRGTSNWALAREWASMATGRVPEIGKITEVRGRTVRIETTPPQPVSVDGEVLMRTPAHVSVAPAALQLVTAP